MIKFSPTSLVLAFFLLLIACFIFFEALSTPKSWFPGDIGGAAFPIVLSLVLILLAIVTLFEKPFDFFLPKITQVKKAIFSLVCLVLYILVLDLAIIPFEIASLLFVFSFIAVNQTNTTTKLIHAAVITIASVAVIALVFSHVLQVVLP